MMIQKPVRTFFAALTLLAGLTGTVVSSIVPSAQAAPLQSAQIILGKNQIHFVAGDCAAIGQQVAAAQGGTLTKATAAVQNGSPVCIVVVLVPGRDGERPRRVEVAVPAK
jgi:predicted cation transporter